MSLVELGLATTVLNNYILLQCTDSSLLFGLQLPRVLFLRSLTGP